MEIKDYKGNIDKYFDSVDPEVVYQQFKDLPTNDTSTTTGSNIGSHHWFTNILGQMLRFCEHLEMYGCEKMTSDTIKSQGSKLKADAEELLRGYEYINTDHPNFEDVIDKYCQISNGRIIFASIQDNVSNKLFELYLGVHSVQLHDIYGNYIKTFDDSRKLEEFFKLLR